jgi:two-component system, NarL family, sensor kinase
VWLVCVTLTELGILLYLENRGVGGTNRFFDPVLPVAAVAFPAAGVFLVSRRPEVRMGWVMCGGVVLALAFFAEQYGVHALQARPGELPGGTSMAWLGRWLWVPGYLLLWTLPFLVFPDGRPPSPRWRPLLWLVIVLVAGTGALAAVAPANPAEAHGLHRLAGAFHALGVFVLAPLCWLSLLVRHRAATPDEREQLRWPLRAGGTAVALPVSVVVTGLLTGAWLPLPLYQLVAALAIAGVPAATVYAVVRHRLYRLDVKADTLANRLLVNIALAVLGGGALAAGLATLEALVAADHRFGLGLASLLVAMVVVLALRSRLERAVDRLLYHRRHYDYRVLTSLGRSLRSTLGADALLPTLVEAVAAGLRLPYVAIDVGQDGGTTVATATHGDAHEGLLELPLVHQNELVGRLTVAPRSPGEPFDLTDRRLLADVAAQVAVVAYALCLTAHLRRSRERLVTAREEERSRLRRDLHDGLQPALSGVALGLDAVRNLLGRGGPDELMAEELLAEELLVRLKTELGTAAADVRRLVYGLRPPALDELGLVGALRQQATMFALAPTSPDVLVSAPDDLDDLPAAVEVATFRICQEALENVRKHARAQTCEVVLAVDDGHLRVEVRDDGRGIDHDARAGVGSLAMRERAAEVGGTCTVEPAAGSGTCVRAVLPLARR